MFERQFKIIQSRLNPELEIEGFLLTMYDNRLRLSNQVYDEVTKHFQSMVFNTIISRNIKLGEAPSYGKPVVMYDANLVHEYLHALVSPVRHK